MGKCVMIALKSMTMIVTIVTNVRMTMTMPRHNWVVMSNNGTAVIITVSMTIVHWVMGIAHKSTIIYMMMACMWITSKVVVAAMIGSEMVVANVVMEIKSHGCLGTFGNV